MPAMSSTRDDKTAVSAPFSLVLVMLVGLLAVGCEQAAAPTSPTSQPGDLVALPEERPAYTFAEDVHEQHPEMVAFLRHFLETCLAGDYYGYRQLVARVADPESRGRFERMLQALKSLSIESVEEIELRDVPPPVYRVVGAIAFREDDPVVQRYGWKPRDIAILVLKEQGEWRMMLAPPGLQPREEKPVAPPTTTTSAPSYPWDVDDY